MSILAQLSQQSEDRIVAAAGLVAVTVLTVYSRWTAARDAQAKVQAQTPDPDDTTAERDELRAAIAQVRRQNARLAADNKRLRARSKPRPPEPDDPDTTA